MSHIIMCLAIRHLVIIRELQLIVQLMQLQVVRIECCSYVLRVLVRLLQPFTYFYFMVVEENIVGAIRIVDKKDGSRKKIAPLFVIPEYRGRGYAQQAIKEVENIHGEDNWELDTILQEKGNCYLYEKMGYQRTGQTRKINDKMTLVFYEKD